MERLLGLAILLTSLIFSGELKAQTNVWSGTGDWSSSSNWSLLAPPQDAQNVTISTGSTVTLTSNSTYTGTTNLNYAFRFDLSPAPQLLVQGNAGALSGTSSILVGLGATLALGDSATTVANPDRLNHAASVELTSGAQLSLTSSSAAGVTSQQAGQLILDQGVSHISLIQANTSAQTELKMTSVTAQPGASLWVTGTNLGQSAGTANSSRILFSSSPALIGGGGTAGTTNISIVPYVVASVTGDEGPSGLVTYDSVNGLRQLNATTEYTSNLATAHPTDNVRLTSSASLATGTTINSLTIVYNPDNAYTLDLGTGNTLNVISGALLDATPGNAGFSAIRPTIQNGTINFGSQSGYLYGLNVASAITGTGGLTIYGGSLSGANTYTGITYVNGGITVGSATALGATGSGNGTVINNGGVAIASGVALGEDITVQNNTPNNGISFTGGGAQMNGNVTLASPNMEIYSAGNNTFNGNITTAGTGAHTLYDQVANTSTLTINGNISDGDGPLSLVFEQAGTTVLAGNNTFSGGLTFFLGALVNVTSATGLGTGSVDDETTLTIALSSDGTIGNQIFGSGSISKTGTNALLLTGNNSFSGGITISDGTVQVGSGGTTGSLGSGTIANSGSLVFDRSNSLTVGGVISGSGLISNIGSGITTLTGSNTYTSSTVINNGGISISSVAAVGSAQPLGENSTVNFTGTTGVLQYTGSTATLHQNLTVASHAAGVVANTGLGVLTLSGTLSKNAGVLTLAGGKFVVSGAITGSSANSDLIIGSSAYSGNTIVGLTTANSYNGPTAIVNGSTLLMGVDNALPVALPSALTLGGSSDTAPKFNTLDLLGHTATVSSLSTAGAGTNQILSSNGSATTPAVGIGSSSTTGNLTVAYSGGTVDTFAGSLGGSGSANNFRLTKSGTGALALTKATGNTYTGGTIVSGGTLYVNNTSGSGTGTGSVTVNAGKLAGSGTIKSTSGGVTINAGGSLSSGIAQTGSSISGTGMTLDNSTWQSQILTVSGTTLNRANLTFALGTGTSGYSGGNASPFDFTNPNTNTTYLSVIGDTTGEISFLGAISITLQDLTNGNLSLRLGTPYLLMAAGSNADYSGLVTLFDGVLSLNGNGYVVGVGTSTTSYTAITFNQVDSSGAALTGGNGYGAPQLYLNDGNLEIVPEPDSWALLLGSLATLMFSRRRTAPPA